MVKGFVRLWLFVFLSLTFALAQNLSANLSDKQNPKESAAELMPKFDNEPYLFALLSRGATWTAHKSPELTRLQEVRCNQSCKTGTGIRQLFRH